MGNTSYPIFHFLTNLGFSIKFQHMFEVPKVQFLISPFIEHYFAETFFKAKTLQMTMMSGHA